MDNPAPDMLQVPPGSCLNNYVLPDYRFSFYISSNRHWETSRDKIQEHWMTDDRADSVVITITFCKNCFILQAPDCNLTLKLSIFFIKQCSKLAIAMICNEYMIVVGTLFTVFSRNLEE